MSPQQEQRWFHPAVAALVADVPIATDAYRLCGCYTPVDADWFPCHKHKLMSDGARLVDVTPDGYQGLEIYAEFGPSVDGWEVGVHRTVTVSTGVGTGDTFFSALTSAKANLTSRISGNEADGNADLAHVETDTVEPSPPTSDTSDERMTVAQAAELLWHYGAECGSHGANGPDDAIQNPNVSGSLYRAAAWANHPENGGDPAVYRRINDAFTVIGQARCQR